MNIAEDSTSKRKLPFWVRHYRYIAVIIFSLCIFMLLNSILTIEHEIRKASTLNTAKNYIQSIESFRTLYTKKVVVPLREQGIEATHDYHNKPGMIPLPATLSMELGEKIGEATENTSFRLYSQYPFPWRKDGGPRDDFEKEALAHLNQNKDTPFYRTEDKDGLTLMRFAKADLMRASCIKCHNTHPQTPKSNWKVGDLRGALEVSLPLKSHDEESTKKISEIRFSIILFFFVLLFLLLLQEFVIRRTYSAINKAKDHAENSFRKSEKNRITAEGARKTAEENQKKVEAALKIAEAARKEAEETTEVMLGREEKIMELNKEIERLKKKIDER